MSAPCCQQPPRTSACSRLPVWWCCAAYGVGAGQGLAYGIILQAIELLTALSLGVPALLREGMTWQDIRRSRADAETPDATPQ